MAENKKSFILYADLIHVVKKLVNQDRENKTNYGGELFLHLLEYVNDTNPIPINFIIDMAFEPIKQQLKRDLRNWDGVKSVRSEIGKIGGIKSGEVRRKKKEANEANALKLKQKEANEAVNGTVTVNDNVKVVENPQLLLSQLTSDQHLELGAMACKTTIEAFSMYAKEKAAKLIATTNGKYSAQTLAKIIVQDYEAVRNTFELKTKPKTDADFW